MSDYLKRSFSQRSSAPAMKASSSRWDTLPTTTCRAPERLRRTPPLPNHRSLQNGPPQAMDPSYLPRLSEVSKTDDHLRERFVGWYDFWHMQKRIFLKYGYPDNPLYEVVTAADIGPNRQLLELCQIPSILEMQVTTNGLCWDQDSCVTNVARGGVNRHILWVEINHSVWMPRDWFEKLRVEGGDIMGKDNGKKYILACTNRKDAWYAMKRGSCNREDKAFQAAVQGLREI